MLHSTIVRKIIEWRRAELERLDEQKHEDFYLGAVGALQQCENANGTKIDALLEKARASRLAVNQEPSQAEYHLAYATELEWFVSILDTLARSPLPRSISF